MSATPASMTDLLERAISVELRRRRAYLDTAEFLRCVTVTVKLQDGPVPIREIMFEDSRMVGRSGRRET